MCFAYSPNNSYLQDERSFPERPELMMVLIWLSRLWGYLSKNAVALSDSSGVQRGLSSKSLNLNVKKNLPDAGIRPGNAPNVSISLYFLLHSLVNIRHLLIMLSKVNLH